jgi:hypothetical protein
VVLARSRACCKAGRSIAARIAIIAITTSSSIKVKARHPGKTFFFIVLNSCDCVCKVIYPFVKGFSTFQKGFFRKIPPLPLKKKKGCGKVNNRNRNKFEKKR